MADKLEFDILANDRASSSFRTAASSALDLAKKLDITALSSKAVKDALDKQGKTSDLTAAQTRALASVLKLTGSEEDKFAAKALVASAAVKRLDESMASSGGAAADLAGAGSSAGIPGVITPMAGLAAAAVALSPVIVTLGTGLAGFGAAAYATVSPVLKAAQATGGLKANLGKLTGPQQQVAKGFLGLQGNFSKFTKALQPQVFATLNSGLGAAKTLLTDVAPVAKSTGTAIAQVAAAIGKGLKSAEWQQFFAWMAANAGPDILLVGQAIGTLTNDLPPLLEALQPVATSVLGLTVDLGKLVGAVEKVDAIETHLNVTANKSSGIWHSVAGAAKQAFGQLVPGAAFAGKLKDAMDQTAPSAQKTGKSLKSLGSQAATSAVQVTDLYLALHKLLDPLTQNIGDAVTFANDQAALTGVLKKSRDALGLHTTAQRASSQAAATAAQDALTLSQSIYTATGSASKAIRPLQSLASQLQNSGAKGDYARQIMRELQAAIDALHGKTVSVHVNTYTGTFKAGTTGLPGRASGGWASGLTLVGERGAELVRLPASSYVYNHAQTAALVSGRSGGATTNLVHPHAARGSGPVRVVLEFRGGGSDTEQLLTKIIRKTVQVKGGGDVQVTYGRTN